MKAIVLDGKGDTPWMLRHGGVLCLDDLEFSLIACPEYSTPTEFINRLLTLYRECFWTAELQQAVLLPVLREVVVLGRSVALADVVDRIRLRDKSPAGKAAADRLESISLAYPKLYESTTNRWAALHEISLYCPVVGAQTPATRFVTWLPIIERFAYLQGQRHRDSVHTTVFLDEAQTSLSKRSQTISGLPPTPVQLLPTTREHGMRFVVATPSWTELDPLVLSQFQVQIALQPSDGRELDAITRSFRLTPAQATFAPGMQRGTGIGKVRGIEHPFLFTYQPFAQAKDIDAQTRNAARERAQRFGTSPNTSAARAEHENCAQQPAAISPPASPPSRVAPVVERSAGISLNSREQEILTHTARRGILLVNELLDELRLHPMQESRTRKNLRAHGLVEEHRITVQSGRGGSALALTATPKAYDLLGIPKPHLGKGGVQHQFFLRELRDHLAATLEVQGADAVIAYNTEKHERLARAVTIAPNDGDTIAIEVEISAPGRTAPVNVARDQHHHVIIASLPKHVRQLRAQITDARVQVVDILHLLAAIRPEAT